MLPDVKVGDSVTHPRVYRFAGHTWRHRYDVLAVEPGTRFGQPDLLLGVRISAVDAETGQARVTDQSTLRWLSQLAIG